MAQIDEIKDIFQTVANAFTSVNDFFYGKVWDLNGKTNIDYPLILLDCMPDYTNLQARGSQGYLPIKKEYKFKIFIYNRWTLAERKPATGKSLEDKQAELQQWLEQYMAEVQRYCLDEAGAGYYVKGLSNEGFFGHYEKNNDRVIQLSEKITVVAASSCTSGTFNYS